MAKKKAPPRKRAASEGPEPRPAAQAAAAVKDNVVQMHERTATRGEEDRVERGKRLAADILVKRDGMDAELAKMVVEGMDVETRDAMIVEWNTGQIDSFKKLQEAEQAAAPAFTSTKPKVEDGEATDEHTQFVDFSQYEALAKDPAFAEESLEAAQQAILKNRAEKRYKELKAKVGAKMRAAGVPRTIVGFAKLTPYKGHNWSLSEELLMLNGVDPAIIAKCWKDTEYDDVRITIPKEMK